VNATPNPIQSKAERLAAAIFASYILQLAKSS
jgi:hypothetical protein